MVRIRIRIRVRSPQSATPAQGCTLLCFCSTLLYIVPLTRRRPLPPRCRAICTANGLSATKERASFPAPTSSCAQSPTQDKFCTSSATPERHQNARRQMLLAHYSRVLCWQARHPAHPLHSAWGEEEGRTAGQPLSAAGRRAVTRRSKWCGGRRGDGALAALCNSSAL